MDAHDVPSIYLLPADLVVARPDAPRTLVTVLGSCVSVCLWDCRGRAGGMNHYLLPRRGPDSPRSTKYGEVALPALLAKLLAMGVARENLRAQVFGGAHVLDFGRQGQRTLGGDNVLMALSWLRDQHIPVVHEDLGGTRGRKIAFDTAQGSAAVRSL